METFLEYLVKGALVIVGGVLYAIFLLFVVLAKALVYLFEWIFGWLLDKFFPPEKKREERPTTPEEWDELDRKIRKAEELEGVIE